MTKRFDKRHSGPYFYLAIMVIIFAFYSLTIAAITAKDCGDLGLDQHWQVMPPEWKCSSRLGPGFG